MHVVQRFRGLQYHELPQCRTEIIASHLKRQQTAPGMKVIATRRQRSSTVSRTGFPKRRETSTGFPQAGERHAWGLQRYRLGRCAATIQAYG